MDTTKRSIAIITDAVRRLQELVGAAATAGEYDAVVRITEWARALSALVRQEAYGEVTDSAKPEEELGDAASRAVANRPAVVAVGPNGDRGDRTRGGEAAARQPRRGPVKSLYPQFFRWSDQLLKVGWSKTERQEYEHKAPRRVVAALSDAIARRSGNGKVFTVEQLLPLKDPADASEVPSYQAYVVLAWLRSIGLVKQHGRRGYSVKNKSDLGKLVRSSWDELSERKV